MATFISPARRRLVETFPCYFPFGGKQTRNVLKDFKGSQQKEIKILFLGCYDLRNVLTTIASKVGIGSGHLNIHLNHPCSLSLARNMLILKVISGPNFNIDDASDLNYLWDLWYNVQWPKSTLEKFVKDVEKLLEEDPDNIPLDYSQFDSLKNIWSSWLLSLREALTLPCQMEKVLKERSEFITCSGMGKELDSLLVADGEEELTFTGAIEEYSMWCEAAMESDDFPESVKRKLAKETIAYFTTGNCSPTKLLQSAAINPTLLEPKTFGWWAEVSSCPFDGYLPLSLRELETGAKEGIATRYCQKKLKSLVNAFRKLRKNIEFHFHFGEDLQFCHNGTTEKFDVIDSSSLADDIGLANLIALSSQRLGLHSDALLLTESFEWGSLASTVLQYVENSLCASLSMIPTMYGLRLANHVELGAATLMDRESPTSSPPITLIWHQAPRFENVPLGVSSSLERCLKRLEKKCFFMEDYSEPEEAERCCLKDYTPLTLYHVASNLAERVGGDTRTWLKLEESKLDIRFNLIRTTLEACADCRPVKLVTFVTSVQKSLFEVAKKSFPAPMLRVILVPTEYYQERSAKLSEMSHLERSTTVWADGNSLANYIDNFNLHFNFQDDSAQLSFTLPQKHLLASSRSLSAALVELVSGTPLMYIGEVQDMKEQDIRKDLPTNAEPSSEALLLVPHLKAIDCQESENEFTVDIRIESSKLSPEGLSISTDQQLPCEAAHRITFSLAQPEGIKPLTLCFPYPVLVDSINATLHHSDRSIKVLLKKALNEPWPCHFSEQPKWKVDNFSRWKKSKSDVSSSVLLMYHVGAQKDAAKLEKMFSFPQRRIHLPEYRLLPPLEIARNAIEVTFAVALNGVEFFSVCNVPPRSTGEFLESALDHQTQQPLLTIRAHPPVLISPSGSPMLLISVYDHCLSKKLIENGHSKAKQAEEDYKRIFPPRTEKESIILWTNEKSVDFLRYVLRLNSTKMKPSGWQENNLPLGKYSPYLATYMSPLYLDNLHPLEESDAEDDN